MLRSILQERRRHTRPNNEDTDSTNTILTASSHTHEELEPWHDWIKRATDKIEGYSKRWGIDDWVHKARKRIFEWAGHVARREDGRWSTAMLDWHPNRGPRSQEERQGRKQARPTTRWEDSLVHYASTVNDGTIPWRFLAADRTEWESHVKHFVLFHN